MCAWPLGKHSNMYMCQHQKVKKVKTETTFNTCPSSLHTHMSIVGLGTLTRYRVIALLSYYYRIVLALTLVLSSH